jgi:hypothetical protein
VARRADRFEALSEKILKTYAFRAAYLLGTGAAGNLPHLRKRLLTICKRTLRRQVQQAGLINYTERWPLTLEFEPSQNEMHLYEAVSAYLQRGSGHSR